MRAKNILSEIPPLCQPTGRNGHGPALPHVPITLAIPYAADQTVEAARRLATFREFCSQAGQALTVFGLSLEKARSREEFQTAYDLLIVAYGLHVWLTPAAAGRLWAAVEVGEWQP